MSNDLTPVAALPPLSEAADECTVAISEANLEVDLHERSVIAVRERRATERIEAERMLLTLRS